VDAGIIFDADAGADADVEPDPDSEKEDGVARGLEGDGIVPGAYTRSTWNRLVKGLIEGVDRSGGASSSAIDLFRRSYVRRYDNLWREYLVGAPEPVTSDPDVKKSPWIRVIEQIGDNTRVELPRDASGPEWIATLHETLRSDVPAAPPPPAPAEGEEAPAAPPADMPPWREYESQLDAVLAETQASQVRGKAALELAMRVARGEPTIFAQSLERIRHIVPSGDSPVEEEKIRAILAMPVLNAFSSVLDRASQAIDGRWTDRIAGRFRGTLSADQLQRLYFPREGELDKFKAEVLDAFYERDVDRPSAVLENREMHFGPKFLDWMRAARSFQGNMYPRVGGEERNIGVRIEGIPSSVLGGQLFVARRELSVVCGAKVEALTYLEGGGAHEFVWTPECQEVSLRVWVRDRNRSERELQPAKQWTGPLAFPEFLQAANPRGRERFQWLLQYSGIPEVAVEYRVRGGEQLRSIRHTSPPRTVTE
jgi:hypothetical protein